MARRMGYGLTGADPAVVGSEANNSEPIETDLPMNGALFKHQDPAWLSKLALRHREG